MQKNNQQSAFYIASVDIFQIPSIDNLWSQRAIYPVGTLMGALVSLGNKTRIAWCVCARRRVSNRRTVRN